MWTFMFRGQPNQNGNHLSKYGKFQKMRKGRLLLSLPLLYIATSLYHLALFIITSWSILYENHFSNRLSFQQKNNERSIVKDSMNPEYQLNGSCRKWRRGDSGEDTSRKRQRRDQTANLDTGNNPRNAVLMVRTVFI